jgi:hypothetical protein
MGRPLGRAGELARIAEVIPDTVRRWIRGETFPSPRARARLDARGIFAFERSRPDRRKTKRGASKR